MRIGITIAQIGQQFKVLALPDQHVQKQRDLVKSIQIARGMYDGEQLSRVMLFESPAVKDKKFKKNQSRSESAPKSSKGKRKA